MAKFIASFPKVDNDAWAKTEKGYLVSFSEGGIAYNIFLHMKGLNTSQIRYYTERNLPAKVADQIKASHAHFDIKGIREITTKGTTAYLVTISDKKVWKVIREVEDEVDVHEEHNKE